MMKLIEMEGIKALFTFEDLYGVTEEHFEKKAKKWDEKTKEFHKSQLCDKVFYHNVWIWKPVYTGWGKGAYYGSKLWKARRKFMFALANYTCEACGKVSESKGKDFELHHLVYNEDFGLDRPQDLLVVCKECHSKKHPCLHWRLSKIERERENKEYRKALGLPPLDKKLKKGGGLP